MAVLLSDNFTRADSTTVPGTPDAGGPYTVRSGTAGISSNQLYFPVAVSTNAGSHMTFPGTSDIDLSLKVNVVTGSSSVLIARWQDASNMWQLRANSTQLLLSRVQAGVLSDVVTVPVTVAAGSVIRFIAYGTRLYGYLNGRLLAEVEDQYYNATYTTAGVGVRSSTNRVDDLTADSLTADPFVTPVQGAAIDPIAVAAGVGSNPAFLYKGRDTKTQDEGNIP